MPVKTLSFYTDAFLPQFAKPRVILKNKSTPLPLTLYAIASPLYIDLLLVWLHIKFCHPNTQAISALMLPSCHIGITVIFSFQFINNIHINIKVVFWLWNLRALIYLIRTRQYGHVNKQLNTNCMDIVIIWCKQSYNRL